MSKKDIVNIPINGWKGAREDRPEIARIDGVYNIRFPESKNRQEFEVTNPVKLAEEGLRWGKGENGNTVFEYESNLDRRQMLKQSASALLANSFGNIGFLSKIASNTLIPPSTLKYLNPLMMIVMQEARLTLAIEKYLDSDLTQDKIWTNYFGTTLPARLMSPEEALENLDSSVDLMFQFNATFMERWVADGTKPKVNLSGGIIEQFINSAILRHSDKFREHFSIKTESGEISMPFDKAVALIKDRAFRFLDFSGAGDVREFVVEKLDSKMDEARKALSMAKLQKEGASLSVDSDGRFILEKPLGEGEFVESGEFRYPQAEIWSVAIDIAKIASNAGLVKGNKAEIVINGNEPNPDASIGNHNSVSHIEQVEIRAEPDTPAHKALQEMCNMK